MSALAGKSAVVTGSTRGIGLAIARALAERGASIWLTARSRDEVDRTVSDLSSRYGARIAGGTCDVPDYDAVRTIVREAEQAHRGLDRLVKHSRSRRVSHVEKM